MNAPCRPPSNVVACRNGHIQFLCERMRPDEVEQFVTLSGWEAYDADEAARALMNLRGVSFTVLDPSGYPVASGGYVPTIPGVWRSWMVGSLDGWSTQWRSMTKATRWLMRALIEQGAQRLETEVLASRVRAIEWYQRSLGLVYEGTRRKAGKGGADVALYAMVAED